MCHVVKCRLEEGRSRGHESNSKCQALPPRCVSCLREDAAAKRRRVLAGVRERAIGVSTTY